MRHLLSLLLIAAVAAPAPGRAQAPAPPTTRLYLLVLEEGGGQFRQAFSAALRRIPDVALVSREEDAQLRLSVLAVCVPRGNCARVATYAVAVAFEEPLSSAEIFEALRAAADSSPAIPRLGSGGELAIAEGLRGELLPYRRVLRRFVASWGRTVVVRAVDETVAEFDARCLAKRRLHERATRELNAGDVSAAHALHRRIEEQSEKWWSC